jgi:hypothetical protein
MNWLEKGYKERFNPGVLLRPGFDSLRSDPRFEELAGRIGLSILNTQSSGYEDRPDSAKSVNLRYAAGTPYRSTTSSPFMPRCPRPQV